MLVHILREQHDEAGSQADPEEQSERDAGFPRRQEQRHEEEQEREPPIVRYGQRNEARNREQDEEVLVEHHLPDVDGFRTGIVHVA